MMAHPTPMGYPHWALTQQSVKRLGGSISIIAWQSMRVYPWLGLPWAAH